MNDAPTARAMTALPGRIGSHALVPLDEQDAVRVRTHFRHLSGEDLRHRFAGHPSAGAVEREVARLASAEAWYGVIGPRDEVLGLLHLTTTGLAGVVKLSVVPAARRQSIGFGLLEVAKRIAKDRGARWLTALALPDNVPMRKLAQLAGMRVRVNRWLMLAYLRLSRSERHPRSDLADLDPPAAARVRPPALRNG